MFATENTHSLVDGNHLEMSPENFAIVRDILRRHVPGRAVWAFGSRASHSRLLKKYSDLDLAVDGSLSIDEDGALKDAFDNSMLPIKVDVLSTQDISPRFLANIEPDFVLIQDAG